MGKYKYEHYSMKDQEDWTDKDAQNIADRLHGLIERIQNDD